MGWNFGFAAILGLDVKISYFGKYTLFKKPLLGRFLKYMGGIPVNKNKPGSGLVKEQAEQEGLDKIFVSSGFEWREPGCSMCLAMNADKLKPEERCASTSNRNFEGRQGRGGRTHLVSPGMAAAAAISGSLDDVRKYQN